MTRQFYKAEILNEYVIVGNDALLKCNIPSFVADFVSVDAWISSKGETFYSTSNSIGTTFGANVVAALDLKGAA